MIRLDRRSGMRRARTVLAAGILSLSGCGGGGGGGGDDGGPMPAPGEPVTISGKAQYQLPPPEPGCIGLDFGAVQLRPIRQATIQLVAALDDSVLDSAVTDDTGGFSLTTDPETNVYIRVRAELKRTGAPAWDVEVRDNTVTETATGTPLDLAQRPLYVLDTAAFDSGTVDQTRDVTAQTGWNASTNSYTGTRSAAPFAVLDVAYSGILLVLGADPQATFAPLDVFWSVNNRATDGSIDLGEIGTSHYRPGARQLFLLGDAGGDPDEFDDHVVAHEWGHYYEDTFSRSDSIGGTHGPGDLLDMRVAFGEGWATAVSGMALDDPTYCDTELSDGFRINIEGGAIGTPGWFNELSVMGIVYDLWDIDIDGADTGSIGFDPIHAVMTGSQATTPAFTSIFSFAAGLKAQDVSAEPLVNDLLEAEDIGSDVNAFGENEDNSGGANPPGDVLPIYTPIAPGGTPVNICSNSQFDRDGNSLLADGNKLAEHRFLRMTIDTPAQYVFDIRTTNTDLPPDDPANDRDQSDPDIVIQLNGVPQNAVANGDLQGFSGVANEEVFTTANTLQPGEYVMALVEFRYQDDQTPDGYPVQTCFDVTITQAP